MAMAAAIVTIVNVVMAAAIVTIVNVTMAAVAEPAAAIVVVAAKPPLSRSNRGRSRCRGRSHHAAVETQQSWS